jgi:hypothetical protein
MHSDAATGKRLSRNGGREYSAPTASPAATAPVSNAPCVTAIASGSAVQTITIVRAPASERSPAAIGSHGLFIRSISTSVIWLTPTIAMFTASPATSVASRSPTPPAASDSAAAIAYSPTTESAVPMIVCGRENRHNTTRGLERACVAATVTRRASRPGGRAASAPPRSG